jgi:hypothetical protein
MFICSYDARVYFLSILENGEETCADHCFFSHDVGLHFCLSVHVYRLEVEPSR